MGDSEENTSSSSRVPALLYVLPLATVLVLAASIFMAGEGEEIRSAFVLGGPTDVPVFRGRLQTRRERAGAIEPLAWLEVTIHTRQGNVESSRKFRTDEEGWVEFSVARKESQPMEIEVIDSAGNVLAKGAPRLSHQRWAASARRRGGRPPVHESGALRAQLEAQRRVLSVPFESAMVLSLTHGGAPAAGAPVILEAQGAALLPDPSAAERTDAEGRLRFGLRPEQHVTSLRVEARYEGERLEFEQTLPVVPGSYWIESADAGYRVWAPVPRDHVWYTFVTEFERLSGGRLELREAPRGKAVGTLPAEVVPDQPGLFVVLSSDADGRSTSTVGYPLDGQDYTLDAWDAYLLDGAPAGRAEAARRQKRVRWSLGGYAALSSLLTLLLFVTRVRGSDRDLKRRLEGAGASEATRERSSLPLVIAVLSLFFAFSLGVLWIVAR